ncbi:asparagine synthase (glutamine-hydrolyzing) [Marinomonas flavescens]|uniref:asparagine synthase (glutamine-hydrolyzing) n=1 Tax=Marinomonas flavescens TaxID=2529379 RepID=UPI0010547DFF|nr:asparagine synthase (glutamine-hydrolyzing) [Marinomonas flavescens]
MCGIAGFLGNSISPDIDLMNMVNTIQHRGPNDQGVWFDEGVGFAHSRLAIVDLSPAGHQPMQSACDRYLIAFNGEIYNHKKLRIQLEQQNQAPEWRGHSDTETLLACFSSWGIEQTLQATVGMFAIALWDKHENVLTLARDRFGEKPLYWGWNNDALLFGSELKALKAFPDFNAQVDRNSLALLLRYNYIPAPHSIYQGIEKLKAGYFVQIAKGQKRCDVEPKAFWSFKQTIGNGIQNPFTGNESQAVDELENRLTESIKDQMLADVPLGAFLSGGVDSSAVVALMQKQSNRPIKTFAIGFDEPGYNEAIYAKEVAQHLGTDHTELYVGADDALALVPKLASIYCEPFADSSQLPTFLVSQMAKRQVTVTLSGDGGDELFGGYNPYHFAPKIWNKVKLLPTPLRTLAAQVLSGLPLPNKIQKLLSVFPAKDRQQFYQLMMSHWTNATDLVIGSSNLDVYLSDPTQWPTTDSFEHWMMAMDAGQYMTDDILVKVDRAAMANSLETRVPLLDHRVFEFAWQLPQHMKIRDGVGKWALREVLYRHVPKAMIDRPKKGFSIPLAQWLRGPLREWAESLLSEKRLISEGYFNPKPIREAWLAHLAGKSDNASKLWSILMFQAWLEAQ